jgi:hypothetical protein
VDGMGISTSAVSDLSSLTEDLGEMVRRMQRS